jgi:hypothetical protein
MDALGAISVSRTEYDMSYPIALQLHSLLPHGRLDPRIRPRSLLRARFSKLRMIL